MHMHRYFLTRCLGHKRHTCHKCRLGRANHWNRLLRQAVKTMTENESLYLVRETRRRHCWAVVPHRRSGPQTHSAGLVAVFPHYKATPVWHILRLARAYRSALMVLPITDRKGEKV